MPRIIIDMDEVLADNYPAFLREAARLYGRELLPEEHQGKRIYDLPGLETVRDILHRKGHFRSLPVMENAIEVVRELYGNHEVFIVTTATEFRYSFLDKYEWLEAHFPFIHYDRIVFCGDKSIVHGDYMIDDKAKNLRGFNGTGLLFTASHNVEETRFHRLNSWLEVRDYFRQQREASTTALG